MEILCKEKNLCSNSKKEGTNENRKNIQHISFLSQMKLHQIEKSHSDS